MKTNVYKIVNKDKKYYVIAFNKDLAIMKIKQYKDIDVKEDQVTLYLGECLQ